MARRRSTLLLRVLVTVCAPASDEVVLALPQLRRWDVRQVAMKPYAASWERSEVAAAVLASLREGNQRIVASVHQPRDAKG